MHDERGNLDVAEAHVARPQPGVGGVGVDRVPEDFRPTQRALRLLRIQ